MRRTPDNALLVYFHLCGSLLDPASVFTLTIVVVPQTVDFWKTGGES